MPPFPDTAFDAHLHLQAFPPALRTVALNRARHAGVTRFGCCGTHPGDWADVLALAAAETGVEPACGLHPWHADDATLPPDWPDRLDALLLQHPGLGVGEIGLDALHPAREAQARIFADQLDLAVKHGRRVALHTVRAHSAILAQLKPRAANLPAILLHAPSCSVEIWNACAALGACLSIGPAVLNPRATKVRALARIVAADRLFFETDAPGMAVNGCAIDALGGRNGPENLPRIIAEVRRLRDAPPRNP